MIVDTRGSPRRYDTAPGHINGDTIYYLRREADLSLRKLAALTKRTGIPVSRASIGNAELGRHAISRAKLQGIADALTVALGRDITIQDLLTKD